MSYYTIETIPDTGRKALMRHHTSRLALRQANRIWPREVWYKRLRVLLVRDGRKYPEAHELKEAGDFIWLKDAP